MNLHLVKRIWTEPRYKPSKKLPENDPRNKTDVIPVSLEDIVNLKKKAFEETLAVHQKALDEEDKLERERKEYWAMLKEEYRLEQKRKDEQIQAEKAREERQLKARLDRESNERIAIFKPILTNRRIQTVEPQKNVETFVSNIEIWKPPPKKPTTPVIQLP